MSGAVRRRRSTIRRHPVVFFALLAFATAGVAAASIVARWDVHPALAWVAALNVLALPLWAWDKRQARRGGFRVPEGALHLVALAGAVPASWLAMRLLRHKTLKRRFRWLYGAFLVLQVAVVLLSLWPELAPWRSAAVARAMPASMPANTMRCSGWTAYQ